MRRLFQRKSAKPQKECHACRTKNPEDVLYCKECGSRFREGAGPEAQRTRTSPAVPLNREESGIQQKKAFLEKGNAYYKSGRYQEALAMYDQALRLDTDYAKAWNNRSLVLEKLGRKKEAQESRDRFLALQTVQQDQVPRKSG